jgi:hypothetical protein
MFKRIVYPFFFKKYNGLGIYIIVFAIIKTLKFQLPGWKFPFFSYDFHRKPLN